VLDDATEGDVYESPRRRVRSYSLAISDNSSNEAGGVHPAKNRCFQLYRRGLHEPKVHTFDEL
jgi:hypothetical protein